MLVLGIDPGTATTGYGLVEASTDGQVVAVHYGVLTTPAGAALPQRLLRLHRALQQLLEQYQPQAAAVEKLFFQRNVTTAMSVGQARGVVLLTLAAQGLPVAEYTPNEVKEAITGYGSAGKSQMQRMVQMLLNLETLPRPDDAADALAVALCHAQYLHWQASVDRQESPSAGRPTPFPKKDRQ